MSARHGQERTPAAPNSDATAARGGPAFRWDGRNRTPRSVFMPSMLKRTSLAGAVALVAALAVPSAASAEIVEIGKAAEPGTSSCPQNCFAVSRTTGYQAKIGEERGPMVVPQDGYVVAWTISLGKPGARQIRFFERRLGGESSAYISVLDPSARLRSRVVSHGSARRLERFFGKTVQFPLPRPLRVKKGQVIALTVPTWAPALAVGLGGDTSWRASRGRGQCDDSGMQTAQRRGATAQYYCLYRTARLAYSATLVTSPYATSG